MKNFFFPHYNHKHQSVSIRYEMGGVNKARLCEWLKSINYDGFGIPEDPNNIEFIRDHSYRDVMQKAIDNGEVTIADMRYIQAFRVPGKPNTFAFNGPQLSDVYDPNDNLVFTSGEIIHNSDNDAELNETYDTYTFP